MDKIIITKVEYCLQCPKWMKCKPSKSLTSQQRFALKFSAGAIPILKECPLEDAPSKQLTKQ